MVKGPIEEIKRTNDKVRSRLIRSLQLKGDKSFYVLHANIGRLFINKFKKFRIVIDIRISGFGFIRSCHHLQPHFLKPRIIHNRRNDALFIYFMPR